MTHIRVALGVTNETSALSFYRGYVRFLKERGCEVSLVASSEGALELFAAEQGGTGVHIPMAREPAPLKDILSLYKWIKYLRNCGPDVVVGATPKAALLSMLSSRLVGCPVRVYQMWGLRLETEKGLKRALLRAMERVTIGCSTVVVCNSSSLAIAAKRDGLLSSRDAVVLGEGSSHGVDLRYYSRDAACPPLDKETMSFLQNVGDAPVIGFVGRLTPDKGLDTLLEALEIAGQRGVRLAVLLVGREEDPELVQRIKASARSIPIHLAGHTRDVRPALKAIDVLCLPSKREGFPNVVLEAAAMAIPAIVANSTGTVDSVVDYETGRVTATEDPEALADVLEDFVENRQVWAQYGEQAMIRARDDFAQETVWEYQWDLIRDLYDSVPQQRARPFGLGN